MQLLGPKVIKKSLRQVIQRLGRRLSIQNPSVKAGDILCLPPELQLAIYHNLDIEGKRQLRLVCRAFNNLLALEVVYDELRIALEKQTIFFIKGASREDEFGCKPFIIKEVSRPSKNDSGETQHLSVDVYWPKFMRDEEELCDERVSIQMEMSELSVTGTLFDEDRIQAVDYSTTLSGKLEKVSACLLRNRFDCSECNNERSVCPGCGGFSRRFPELFTSCGWDMPCPVCIGFNTAFYAKDIQDDMRKLRKLWKEVDEMLKNDKTEVYVNPRNRYSFED